MGFTRIHFWNLIVDVGGVSAASNWEIGGKSFHAIEQWVGE